MLDMKVTDNCRLHHNYCLLKLTADLPLPDMNPGQFVQVRVPNSATTFLRRPISVNFVDKQTNELWLLIQLVGDGTRKLAEAKTMVITIVINSIYYFNRDCRIYKVIGTDLNGCCSS